MVDWLVWLPNEVLFDVHKWEYERIISQQNVTVALIHLFATPPTTLYSHKVPEYNG